jgi:flagellar assembly protein FliH
MSNLWSPRLRDEAQRADFWPSDGAESGAPTPGISAEAEAFARGLEEGRRTVEAEFAGEREALLQMVHAADALAFPTPGMLASMMVTAVERLVSDIVGNAPVDAVLLRERAAALASLIAVNMAPVLFVHPQDAVLIDVDRLDVAIATDAELSRGSLQIRAGDERAEDGVQAALQRFRAQIAEMGIAL